MLKISQGTFEQYAEASESEFVSKLADFLVSNVTALRDVPPTEHLQLTRQIISVARKFDFRSEIEISRFALTAAMLGPDFPSRFPGAREILEMKESAEYRSRLLEYFTRELFETLER